MITNQVSRFLEFTSVNSTELLGLNPLALEGDNVFCDNVFCRELCKADELRIFQMKKHKEECPERDIHFRNFHPDYRLFS